MAPRALGTAEHAISIASSNSGSGNESTPPPREVEVEPQASGSGSASAVAVPSQLQPPPRRSARAEAASVALAQAQLTALIAGTSADTASAGAGASTGPSSGGASRPKRKKAPTVARPKGKGKGSKKKARKRADPDSRVPYSRPNRGRFTPPEPAVDDADVIEDDAFALALKYASPSPSRSDRAPLPSPTLSSPPKEREVWDEEMYGADESFLLEVEEEQTERGRSRWMRDVGTRMRVAGEGKRWVMEGFAGLEAMISNMVLDEVETVIAFNLEFEDMDGSSFSYGLNIAFEDLSTYPSSCETSVTTTSPATPAKRAHLRVFERFSNTYSLTVNGIMERLGCALQGDDDASGGQAPAESGSVVVEVGMPVAEVAVPAPVVPVAEDKKEGAKGQVDGEKEEEEEVERTVTVAVAVSLVVAAEA